MCECVNPFAPLRASYGIPGRMLPIWSFDVTYDILLEVTLFVHFHFELYKYFNDDDDYYFFRTGCFWCHCWLTVTWQSCQPHLPQHPWLTFEAPLTATATSTTHTVLQRGWSNCYRRQINKISSVWSVLTWVNARVASILTHLLPSGHHMSSLVKHFQSAFRTSYLFLPEFELFIYSQLRESSQKAAI